MSYQGMGSSPLGLLYNRGESAINGWNFLGWLDVLAMDNRFFEKISLRTKNFGCAFEGLDVFRCGRFQRGILTTKPFNAAPLSSVLISENEKSVGRK